MSHSMEFYTKTFKKVWVYTSDIIVVETDDVLCFYDVNKYMYIELPLQ